MWFGLGVTVFFMWLVLRDAPLAEVGRVIARADWVVLLGLSIPSYLVTIYLRALRWRHLTDPIQPIGTAPLARAVAVGFMANNLFPLRIGEVVRCWYLSRETGASTASIFGTVILERVIDTVTVISLAMAMIGVLGAESDSLIARGAIVLLPVAVVPMLILVGLRLAPERVIALAGWFLRPFPTQLQSKLQELLRSFSEGLGALRGGSHLIWIAVHSLTIWLIASTVPIIAGLLALGVDVGTPLDMLIASWTTLAAVGVAVALPSAPGFFGPYHYAARLALERFGVAPESAIAVGTLVHAIFWIQLTLIGLAVLRLRNTSLSEIDEAAGGSNNPHS